METTRRQFALPRIVARKTQHKSRGPIELFMGSEIC